MAHELRELDKAAYALTPAWHGLGTVVDHAMTAEEALDVAGLNWNVSKEPLTNPATGEEIPDFFATVRDDLPAEDVRRYLGMVGGRYTPIQNREAMAMADAIVGESGAHYESAFSMKNGRLVAMLIKLPEVMRVLEDVHELYLLAYNEHTGSRPAEFMLTSVRVVCNNTVQLAMRQARNRYRIRHTANAASRISEARYVLGTAKTYFAQQAEVLEELTTKHVDRLFVDAYTKALFPTQPNGVTSGRMQNLRARVKDLFNGAQAGANNPGVAGTRYGLWCAISQYADHERTVKPGDRDVNEARAEAVLLGSGADFKQQAFDLLLKADELVMQAAGTTVN